VPAPRCAAVVTAAGASTRMGGAKKEYLAIGGVPVLALAIRPFLEAGMVRVVVTLPAGHLAEAAAMLAPHLDAAALTLVEGGETRQESVRRGLLALAATPPDLVLVHDGARPWLARDVVSRVVRTAERFGACVPVVEVTEAVKEVGLQVSPSPSAPDPDRATFVLRHLPRNALRFAQTPQGFSFPRLLAAHEQARAEGLSFVDDAEVFARFVGPVAWVSGDPANRKITFEEDLGEAP
jgi:2-C-methyl-D-erythritol 4-phosphate cytidylyltransferase